MGLGKQHGIAWINDITNHFVYKDMDDYNEISRKISNISRTKSQNLNVSRLGLQLSLRNIFKPSVK